MPSPLDLRKARVLAFIHLFIILIGVLFEIANRLYPGFDSPATLIGIGLVSTLAFIFKRYGNFFVSGNLISLILFIVLLESVFLTGGLYSDNLLWIMAAPLTALLFANPGGTLLHLLRNFLRVDILWGFDSDA